MKKLVRIIKKVISKKPEISNAEHCIFCGNDIPEGRQVCPACEKELTK